jgi:hypothetical protein
MSKAQPAQFPPLWRLAYNMDEVATHENSMRILLCHACTPNGRNNLPEADSKPLVSAGHMNLCLWS